MGATAATNVVVVNSTTDHGHDPGGKRGSGDGNGDESRVSERESGERVHLRGGADGEQCLAEQRAGGRWDRGNDHGDELRRGSDGDDWRDGGDQRGGREQHDRSQRQRRRARAGAVTVTVTVNGQSGSLTNGFTYVVPPTVTSVSPNSGSTAGGTAVTITGTNFAAGATVTFGSDGGDERGGREQHHDHGDDPGGQRGSGDGHGDESGSRQSGSLANGFTYVVVPTVSSVSPNNGPVAGGTAVTITGTNFAAGATVTFGGTAATNVVVANSTTITATTPAQRQER